MKLKLLFAALVVLASVVLPMSNASGQSLSSGILYTIGTGPGNVTEFGRIDFDPLDPLATKTYSVIDESVWPDPSRALTTDGAGGLYFLADSGQTLRAISTTGGVSGTAGTNASQLAGLARAEDGTYYGYDYSNDRLVTVDMTSDC